jgi:hypothetical protein
MWLRAFPMLIGERLGNLRKAKNLRQGDIINATGSWIEVFVTKSTVRGLARLAEVKRVLARGGLVRFIWASSHTILISANGKRLTTLDGRTYQGFLKTIAPNLKERRTGSTETRDLIIEWKL